MIDETILHDFANEPVEGVLLAMLTNLQDRQAAGLAIKDGIGHDLSLAIAAAGCRGFIVGALVAMDDPHLASGIVSLVGEFSAEDEMDQHRTSARSLLEKARA